MTSFDARRVVTLVAEMIRGARALQGIGLRACAEASGISIATLSRIERGGIPDAITFIKAVEWLQKQSK